MRGKISSLVFVNIKSEILTKNSNVDVMDLVMSLELRGEVWTVKINLHVIKVGVVFKVTEWDGSMKELDVNRGEGVIRSEGWRIQYLRSHMKPLK